VLVLIGIGFLAGIITAISPCVLPVLPIILAGGASGRKPFPIIAGLVASFTLFTLFAAWLLDQLGLPQDTLRNVAIGLLFVVAATLLVPRLGELLERPFLPLTRRRAGGGGFLLGASLGLVFVPCAGPVLAAVTVISASNHVGGRAIALTLSYALGAAVPMTLIALGGRRLATRLRAQAVRIRVVSGVVIALTATAIAFHLDTRFQTAIPGYTKTFQDKVESSGAATRELQQLRGGRVLAAKRSPAGAGLPDYGAAPEFRGNSQWFNSPPLTMKGLRGKVVLVDFWTYSCINCLRTLPHLEAWDAAYRSKGLVIVGVHTPEFAFEHSASNVRAAIERLGVRYPVPLDNEYATWNAYGNQYWPAEYLIDRNGHVRHTHFGEGEYGLTESLIRQLLAVKKAPMARKLADPTPKGLVTPESYLGYSRLERYAGSPIARDKSHAYSFPAALGQNELAYGGRWIVTPEKIVAGRDSRLRLHFHASKVYLVLGGHGSLDVLVDGKRERTVNVTTYRLYTLVNGPSTRDATLELRFSPGVEAYAFTFG